MLFRNRQFILTLAILACLFPATSGSGQNVVDSPSPVGARALPTINAQEMRLVPAPRAPMNAEGIREEQIFRQRNMPAVNEASEVARTNAPSPSSSGALSDSVSGAIRRAPGHALGEIAERQYGRLIVMADFDSSVEVKVDGQLYPDRSLQGVLLIAGVQYEVSIVEPGTSSAGNNSSGESVGRVLPIRLSPGETRVLMANTGTGAPPVSRNQQTATTRSRSSNNSQEEEEEEDVGFLGVSSTPTGTIHIDGESIGQVTPARRVEIEAGRHEVRIFYDDEDRFSETKNVLIRSGVNTNVFFRLRDEE